MAPRPPVELSLFYRACYGDTWEDACARSLQLGNAFTSNPVHALGCLAATSSYHGGGKQNAGTGKNLTQLLAPPHLSWRQGMWLYPNHWLVISLLRDDKQPTRVRASLRYTHSCSLFLLAVEDRCTSLEPERTCNRQAPALLLCGEVVWSPVTSPLSSMPDGFHRPHF